MRLSQHIYQKKASTAYDPDEARLAMLHRRLLLWYSCFVAGLILLISFLIAIAMPQWLTLTLRSELSGQVEQLARTWTLTHTCPYPKGEGHYLLACFDSQGHLLASRGSSNDSLRAQFNTNSLALAALRERAPVDDAFDSTGSTRIETQVFFVGHNPALFRYARPIQNSQGSKLLGVLQMGVLPSGSSGQKELLIDNILLGTALAELFSPLLGWFLANRAIQPTRLAFRRQKEFIANASHELRTPLALLRANAEVLLRGREHLPEEDIELLEDIVAEAVHMNSLTNQMLLLARMDAGQQHLEQEVIDLAELVKQVGRQATALAEQQGIKLNLETAPARTLGDRVLLEQLVLILLDNALKYNRPGGAVSMICAQNKGQVFLEVRDTGIGIPEEHLARLGERFYRVDKARSREQGGNGLGLSIAQNIASLHNCQLVFTNIPGAGICVRLTFFS